MLSHLQESKCQIGTPENVLPSSINTHKKLTDVTAWVMKSDSYKGNKI